MKLIKVLFLFSLISLSWIVLADDIDYQVCQNLAGLYGHNLTPQTLPEGCRQEALEHSSILAQIQNDDASRVIFATSNMLYVDHLEAGEIVKSELLAGENAKLGEVLALDIDHSKQHLFVLSRHADGVAFAHHDLNFIGNTAPLRSYKSSELMGVISFRIDVTEEKIYLLDQDKLAIKVYRLYADKHGRTPAHDTQEVRAIQGEQTQILNPVDLTLSENELFLLEPDKIHVYTKHAQGNLTPIRSIAGSNTQLNQAKMISLDLEQERIIVINGNGESLSFNLHASGDIPPLE